MSYDIKRVLTSWLILRVYSHRYSIYKPIKLNAYMLKWLPNDKNKNTTQESTYINNIMSEINDMDEWPEGISL